MEAMIFGAEETAVRMKTYNGHVWQLLYMINQKDLQRRDRIWNDW